MPALIQCHIGFVQGFTDFIQNAQAASCQISKGEKNTLQKPIQVL